MPNPLNISEYDYVVFNFDGNNNDRDDIAAVPIAALLAKAADIEAKTTFFIGNNIAEYNQPQLDDLRESGKFAASQGIEVVDIQAGVGAAIRDLSAIYGSGKKILVLEGGPMEFTHRALGQTKSSFHDNITLVSHSGWNENRSREELQGIGEANTWSDIGRDFPRVTRIDIVDQNAGTNNTRGFNNKDWTWMNSSDIPVVEEARDKMFGANGKTNDPSDAGMLFWVLTGEERGTALDAKAYLEPRLSDDDSGNGNNNGNGNGNKNGNGNGNNNGNGNPGSGGNNDGSSGGTGSGGQSKALAVTNGTASFFGTNVGATHEASLSLPEGVPEDGVRLSITLWDLDSRQEASLSVNGTEVALPGALVADGATGKANLTINPSLLVKGENTLTFTFESNLNGSTGGYRIDGLSAVALGEPTDDDGDGNGSDDGAEPVEITGDGLSFFNTSVGATKSVTLKLPDGVPSGGVAMAITAYDIDALDEATLLVNGTEVALPESIVAGGETETATVTIASTVLKGGDNVVTFEFSSNLNGTTGGFRIEKLSAVALGEPGGKGGPDADDRFVTDGDRDTVNFLGGNDVILDFDVDSGGERTFDEVAFAFGGRKWSLESAGDFLEIVNAIESEGIVDGADAYLVNGNDLELELAGLGNLYIPGVGDDIGIDALRDAGVDERATPSADYPGVTVSDGDVLFG